MNFQYNGMFHMFAVDGKQVLLTDKQVECVAIATLSEDDEMFDYVSKLLQEHEHLTKEEADGLQRWMLNEYQAYVGEAAE